MKQPQLRPEDVDFLIENERPLLDDLYAFARAIRTTTIQDRMKYVVKYQNAYENHKREKEITQRVFNRVVAGNYSIKQISYIATAVQELIMTGKYKYKTVTAATKDIVAHRQHYRCAICGEMLKDDVEADHKVPRVIIGEHWGDANLQILCHTCNQDVKATTVGMQSRLATVMKNRCKL